MHIETIRRNFAKESVYYSKHAYFEMENDEFGKIYDHEVFEAIMAGEVIQEYPEDKPYPSCLILGLTKNNRPLHIVCACDLKEDISIVITVYHPDPLLWDDTMRRKKK